MLSDKMKCLISKTLNFLLTIMKNKERKYARQLNFVDVMDLPIEVGQITMIK